jgi:hypothetical protein
VQSSSQTALLPLQLLRSMNAQESHKSREEALAALQEAEARASAAESNRTELLGRVGSLAKHLEDERRRAKVMLLLLLLLATALTANTIHIVCSSSYVRCQTLHTSQDCVDHHSSSNCTA